MRFTEIYVTDLLKNYLLKTFFSLPLLSFSHTLVPMAPFSALYRALVSDLLFPQPPPFLELIIFLATQRGGGPLAPFTTSCSWALASGGRSGSQPEKQDSASSCLTGWDAVIFWTQQSNFLLWPGYYLDYHSVPWDWFLKTGSVPAKLNLLAYMKRSQATCLLVL